jgi:ubiquinone/menaquinone biosynthesis C-methylase UbiE
MKSINIENVNIGFGNMADEYDAMQATNIPVRIMRNKFYKTVLSRMKPPAKMLELNCGSGIDALYFASQGFDILATDISDKMLFNAVQKNIFSNLSFKKLNLLELHRISQNRFDIIISNLGGLNCITDLSIIANKISSLLNKNGFFIASVMPRFCLWEFALLFKGEFKRALRRMKLTTEANVGGEKVLVKYYSPGKFYKYFKDNFNLVETKALRIFAPPQPATHWYQNHPIITRFLDFLDTRIENFYSSSFIGDYYIIVLQKK